MGQRPTATACIIGRTSFYQPDTFHISQLTSCNVSSSLIGQESIKLRAYVPKTFSFLRSVETRE